MRGLLQRRTVVYAAFGSSVACVVCICLAASLEHSGWRYYQDHGVLYQINDHAVAAQWCGVAAAVAGLGCVLALMWIGRLTPHTPRYSPPARPTCRRVRIEPSPTPEPFTPLNPRMYYSNRR